MKKCNRCNNVIDWERPFCPLCGGQVTDVPKSARPEPVIATTPTVAENTGIPQIPQVAAQIEPPSPPAPQLPPANIAAVPPPPAPPIPAAAMIHPAPPSVPPQPVPDVPASWLDSVAQQAGSISQIHNTPGAAASFTPPPPLPGGMISQIHQSQAASFPTSLPNEPSLGQQPQTAVSGITRSDNTYNPLGALLAEESNFSSDADTEHFDDQITELLKRGTSGAGNRAIEDPIEALLQSGPKLDGAPLFPSTNDVHEEPSQFAPPSPAFGNNLIPNLPDDVKPDKDSNNSQDDFLRMFPGAKG